MSAWDQYPPDGENVVQFPLRTRPARMPDPATIPPRPWLYGTMLLRGFVTVLVAPGGTGKSQLAMAIGVAMGAGNPILGHPVHHQANVWLINLEDPLDELDRRLAALMIHHRVGRDALADRLYMHSGRERRVCMAQRGADGATIVHPDREPLIDACRESDIGLLIVDPYVKSHSLAENSNDDMDAAATAWAEVAQEAACAVLLVHHVRKGVVEDIDAARGAVALIAAARAAYLLRAMAEGEAAELGVDKEDRWRHVRLDDGKANMAPRASVAQWFKMEMLPLGNGTEAYPRGDNVAALARWEPPTLWSSFSDDELNAALDRISEGPAEGELFGVGRGCGPGSPRWAGHVLVRQLGVSDAQAGQMIFGWLQNGLLERRAYIDPRQRKPRSGVAVNNSRRPGAL